MFLPNQKAARTQSLVLAASTCQGSASLSNTPVLKHDKGSIDGCWKFGGGGRELVVGIKGIFLANCQF
jgi:hypothetical protein